MADFRKVLFAFAAVALLAGLTVPAYAQSQCSASSGVNTLVRAEGYNDLIGDITLICNLGTPTPQGVLVPQVIEQSLVIARVAEQQHGVEAILAIELPEELRILRRLDECPAPRAGRIAILGHQQIRPKTDQPRQREPVKIQRAALQFTERQLRRDHDRIRREQPGGEQPPCRQASDADCNREERQCRNSARSGLCGLWQKDR